VSDVDKEDQAATDLVKGALAEARELIKSEMELALKDVQSEVGRLRSAAVAFAVAAFASNVALAMVLFAVAFATHEEIAVAVAAAVALFVIACAAGLLGRRAMPANLLARTRQRLAADVHALEGGAHGA
jgi:uncharacterized membrane protein YqjE